MEKEIYKPFRKPGDKPLYVGSWSNHPPRVIKNIPVGINKRLFEISGGYPPYLQVESEKCGYKDKLVWMEEGEFQQKNKRSRSKKVIWFNPPYSVNVNTNVGKEYLGLLDKHFPKNNPLHKV